MKNLLTTLFFYFISIFIVSSQTFDWVNTAKRYDNVYTLNSELDGSGNVYSLGVFRDSISFDNAVGGVPMTLYTLNNGYSTFFSKQDNNGNVVWLKQLDSDIKNISVDKLGNLYLYAYYRFDFDADPGLGVHLLLSNTNMSTFNPESYAVIKLDSNGTFVWAKNIISQGLFDMQMTVDKEGGIYFAGRNNGKTDLDPSTNGIYPVPIQAQAVIFKWSTDGNFIWGGWMMSYVYFSSIVVNKSRVNYTGVFSGTVDFNIDTTIVNNRSAPNLSETFLLNYDTAGVFKWVHKYIRANTTDIKTSYLDNDLNSYYTGNFNSTVDFDFGPGQTFLTSLQGSDVFILKMDSLGVFKWVNQIKTITGGGPNLEIILNGNSTSNIYITSRFNGRFDVNPLNPGVDILYTNSQSAITTLRYDINGNFEDYWIVGDNNNINVSKMKVGNRNDLTYLGFFANTVDFDPTSAIQNRSSIGSSVFFLRLNQCFETDNQLSIQSCGNYYSPYSNKVWTANGTYSDTTTNFMGCDSVLDITLSIVNIDSTIFLLGSMLASNDFSSTYQWLNCSANYSVIPNETGQIFQPTVNGSYTLELTKNGCVDTTACFNYTLVGTKELSLEKRINIFPNPSNGLFNVVVLQGYEQLYITDISGRIIHRSLISNDGIQSIELSQYDNGIYFITIENEGERVVKKIIKH